MAEEFSVDSMVDMYLYENGQLLEKLEEIILETKDDDAFDENNINEIFRIMHTIKVHFPPVYTDSTLLICSLVCFIFSSISLMES